MTRQDIEFFVDRAIRIERRRIIVGLRKIHTHILSGSYGFEGIDNFTSLLQDLIDVFLTKEDKDYLKKIETDSMELS